MSTFRNTSLVSKTMLMKYIENMAFIERITDKKWAKDFQGSTKVGDTINIKSKNKFTVRDGTDASYQTVSEITTPLQLSYEKGVDFYLTDKEMSLSVDGNSELLDDAVDALSVYCENLVMSLVYKDFYLLTGNGAAISNDNYIVDAARIMTEHNTPNKNRFMIVDPITMAKAAQASLALQQPIGKGEDIYMSGVRGRAFGFDWIESNFVQRHTTGLFTTSATPAVASYSNSTSPTTGQVTTTLSIDGLNAAATTFKAGDVFTIPGVYSVVNSTGSVARTRSSLQQFVVTEDVTSAAGAASLVISPPIITSGVNQTVDSAPEDGDLLTFVGTEATSYAQNLFIHKDAVAMAFCKFENPKGLDMVKSNMYNGISIRLSQYWDQDTGKWKNRIDTCFGVKTVNPSLGGRLYTA